MRSLQARLIVGLSAALAVLLISAGLVLTGLLREALASEVDASLVAAVRLLQPLVEYDQEGIDLDLAEVERTEAALQPLVELWGGDGEVVRRSAALGGADLPTWPTLDEQPDARAIQLPDGRPGRAAIIRFALFPDADQRDTVNSNTTPPQHITLMVARPTDQLTRQQARVAAVLALSIAAVVGLSLPVVVIAVTTTMRPVRRLGRDLDQIGHDNLARHLPTHDLPSEIAPLIDRLNELLRRLDAAFQRERSFTGDAAHELRTPLAAMRSIIEVTRMRPRNAEECNEALDDLFDVTSGMQTMVQKLLALARLDRSLTGPKHAVRLFDAISEAWRPLAGEADARRLTRRVRVASELTCRVDPDLLMLVLGNVLANAVRYADAGGRIDIRAGDHGSTLELTITNTGCELDAAAIAHIWKRFWRGDQSRADAGWHSGLGLSLVDRAMRLVGGEANATVTVDHLFILTLILPTSLEP